MWQDWALAIIQWVFVAALIPTILHKTHKPAFSSSLITALGMTVVVYTYYTLDLWQATIGAGVTALAWYILLYQRWRLNQQEK